MIVAPFNLGHQRAIVYALRLLADRVDDADRVVTMDSDGEDQPSDVPRLLDALAGDHASLALAQRTQRSESLPFRIMYAVYRVAFRLLTGTTVRSGNFAVQRGDSLKATIGHPTFDLCYSSSLLALRRPTAMVPCARGTRFAGTSRMNAQSLMAHGVRMLLPFAERIAVRAMVLATLAGGALVALLVVVGVRRRLGRRAAGPDRRHGVRGRRVPRSADRVPVAVRPIRPGSTVRSGHGEMTGADTIDDSIDDADESGSEVAESVVEEGTVDRCGAGATNRRSASESSPLRSSSCRS